MNEEAQENKPHKTECIYLDHFKENDLSDMQEFSHEENHNDEDNVIAEENRAWVPCSVCSEKFRSKLALARHMTLHSEHITCEFCKKT